MNKKNMKLSICEAIDNKKEEIILLGQEIYNNPETGFKEFYASKLVSERFKALGVDYTTFGDIPGGKITLDTGREGPSVAILGELDAIICPNHPDSNKETGAVHACGHNIQISAMFGAALGILDSGVLDCLCGKIHFIAVPAEEYIEIEYRNELRNKGTIHYLGGKPELLYRGVFDDVDMCMMVHADTCEGKFGLGSTNNGCFIKKIRYIGKAAHAGSTPQEGINALYAANIGLAAINSLRETFIEEDYIRVHPIITKGGDVVNVIPDDVRIETFVRGKTMDAIMKANKKVTRALFGGAVAMGADVEIEDIPGYFPFTNDENLNSLAKSVMEELVPQESIEKQSHSKGSTDLGDLSTLMPVVQPYVNGFRGRHHGADFQLVDTETAYLSGPKLLALMAVELLWEDGSLAYNVINEYKPVFKSKEEYLEFADQLFSKKLLKGDA